MVWYGFLQQLRNLTIPIDESRTEDEEFNKVIRLQDVAGNDDFFKMAPTLEDSDDANLASSEPEYEDPNHRIFAASLRPDSHLPLSASRGFTVKTWEPKLTVPRSPHFATNRYSNKRMSLFTLLVVFVQRWKNMNSNNQNSLVTPSNLAI